MRNLIRSLDKKSFNLIIIFENIAFIFAFLGTIGLYLNLNFFHSILVYHLSVNIFKIGFVAGVCSLCFGLFFNRIKARNYS